MSGVVERLMTQIRQLPYADMMLVAQVLADEIDTARKVSSERQVKLLDAKLVADALDGMTRKKITVDAQTAREEEILRAIFRRKTTFNVQRMNSGWVLQAASHPHMNVSNTELRPMFGMMLDQAITMHVLTE